MNKLEIEYEKENKIKSINWNELLYKTNFPEMKILELFYVPKSDALIFSEVYKRLRSINITKKMVYITICDILPHLNHRFKVRASNELLSSYLVPDSSATATKQCLAVLHCHPAGLTSCQSDSRLLEAIENSNMRLYLKVSEIRRCNSSPTKPKGSGWSLLATKDKDKIWDIVNKYDKR